ncbi:hypothetical protein AWB78_08433 [Caballeronia calidae]|uniref:Uncharacterized protein n=1 Tax=Caballeronia calidae TaxID=1777139 RepID=A0A158EK83_9BURK|nr:hypothetical protein AWB78_08433 [Caballeronia calidae]
MFSVLNDPSFQKEIKKLPRALEFVGCAESAETMRCLVEGFTQIRHDVQRACETTGGAADYYHMSMIGNAAEAVVRTMNRFSAPGVRKILF